MAKLTKKQIQALASKGRGGDSIVAHINPQEAALLKAHGGSGTINPQTGLPEFVFLGYLGQQAQNLYNSASNTLASFDDAAHGFVGGVLSGPQKVWNEASKTLAGFDDAANKVAKQLGQTVEAIASDPKKLAMVAIAVYYPQAAQYIGQSMMGPALAAQYPALTTIVGNTVLNTAANGGNIESAAKNALIQQGSAYIANQVSANLSTPSTDFQTFINNFASNAAAGVSTAILLNKDPTAALLMGGASAAANAVLANAYGFDTLPDAAKKAVTAAVGASITKQNVTGAVADSLIYSATKAARNFVEAQKEIAASDTLAKANIKNLTPEQFDAIKGVGDFSGYNFNANNIVKTLEFGANNNIPISADSIQQSAKEYNSIDTKLNGLSDLSKKYGIKLNSNLVDYATKSDDIFGAKNIDKLDNLYALSKKQDFEVTDDVLNYLSKGWENVYGVAAKADAEQTSRQEVIDFFKPWGITPTEDQIKQYAGSIAEAQSLSDINKYGSKAAQEKAAKQTEIIRQQHEAQVAAAQAAKDAQVAADAKAAQERQAEIDRANAEAKAAQEAADAKAAQETKAQQAGFKDYAEQNAANQAGFTKSSDWKDNRAQQAGFNNFADQTAATNAGFTKASDWKDYSTTDEGEIIDYYRKNVGRDPTASEVALLVGNKPDATNLTDANVEKTITNNIKTLLPKELQDDFAKMTASGTDPSDAFNILKAFNAAPANLKHGIALAEFDPKVRDLVNQSVIASDAGNTVLSKSLFNQALQYEASIGDQGNLKKNSDGSFTEKDTGYIWNVDKNGNWSSREPSVEEQKRDILTGLTTAKTYTNDLSEGGFNIHIDLTQMTDANGNVIFTTTAKPQSEDTKSFFDKYAGLFSSGTSNPNAEKMALFGSGATGNPKTDGFTLFATDAEKKNFQVEFWPSLEKILDDPNATDSDKKIAQQTIDGSKTSTGQDYVSPLNITKLMQAQGYTPTEDEASKLAGFKTPDQVSKEVTLYVDPKVVDIGEAKDALIKAGITAPTDEQIKALVGQYQESDLAAKAVSAAQAKAKADADAKAAADAKAKADAAAKAAADAQAKAAADAAAAKAQADAKAASDAATAKAKADADAKAAADAQAKAQADAKAAADAQAKADAEAKAQADAKSAADAKAAQEAKAQADAQAKAQSDAKAAADAKSAQDKAMADKAAADKAAKDAATAKAAADAEAKRQADMAEAARQAKMVEDQVKAETAAKAAQEEAARQAEIQRQAQIAADKAAADKVAADKAAADAKAQADAKAAQDAAKTQEDAKAVQDAQAAKDAASTKAISDVQSGLTNLNKATQDQYNSLTDAQKAEVAARVQANQGLEKSISDVQSGLGTQITNLTKTTQDQYNSLSAADKAAADALVKQGKTLGDAITTVQSGVTDLTKTVSDQYASLTAEQKKQADELVAQGKSTSEAISTVQGSVTGLSKTVADQYASLNANEKALADSLAKQGVDLGTAIDTIKKGQAESQSQFEAYKTAQEKAAADKAAADKAAADKAVADKAIADKAAAEAAQRQSYLTTLGGLGFAISGSGVATPTQAASAPIPAPTDLAPEYLRGQITKSNFESPLAPFEKMVAQNTYTEPTQESQPMETAQIPQEQPSQNYFSYGNVPDINQILNPNQQQALQEQGLLYSKNGGMVAPLLMAQGGPLSVVHHSGKARIDFRQGSRVSGAGDGQSDDIPAMLADGEYVLDADIVAALGNGSTKAGSDLLDKFREQIRNHKRNGSLKDIPPPAKSPLEYLAMARKGKR